MVYLNNIVYTSDVNDADDFHFQKKYEPEPRLATIQTSSSRVETL